MDSINGVNLTTFECDVKPYLVKHDGGTRSCIGAWDRVSGKHVALHGDGVDSATLGFVMNMSHNFGVDDDVVFKVKGVVVKETVHKIHVLVAENVGEYGFVHQVGV